MGRPPKYSKDMMLEAAERVVASEGAPALSFDAVAAAAGVSKGAVLHHFPTREALVEAMVGRLVARLASPPGGRPGPAEAIESARVAHGGRDPTAAALLAAVTQDLRVLAPLRAAGRAEIDALVAAGLSPLRARLLRLALDGLWMSELFRVSPLTEAERDAFLDGLRAEFEAGSD